jgi:hypothetical protein
MMMLPADNHCHDNAFVLADFEFKSNANAHTHKFNLFVSRNFNEGRKERGIKLS